MRNKKPLKENAFNLKNLSDDLYVLLKHSSDFAVFNLMSKKENRAFGSLGIQRPDDLSGPCDGAWIVATSKAEKGWGPFLYDLALEWATSNGGKGLTSDRDIVSNSAKNVWDFYAQKRNDVHSDQLDDTRNTLTPNENDNCEQNASEKTGSWEKSSLSKRFSKTGSLLQTLDKMGKLVVQESARKNKKNLLERYIKLIL